MAEAVRWGTLGARINTISAGIVMTRRATDELTGPRVGDYRRMIEVGAVAALLMGPDGGFISGSDFLMDGGVTAAYWYADLAEVGIAVTGSCRLPEHRSDRKVLK